MAGYKWSIRSTVRFEEKYGRYKIFDNETIGNVDKFICEWLGAKVDEEQLSPEYQLIIELAFVPLMRIGGSFIGDDHKCMDPRPNEHARDFEGVMMTHMELIEHLIRDKLGKSEKWNAGKIESLIALCEYLFVKKYRFDAWA